MNAARETARHWWSRRRPFTRAQLDSKNWPHPRPARDPRIIASYICLMIASGIQSFRGVSPTSVQGRNDFDFVTVLAFAAIACVGSVLVIYAAFVRSQYWSFVTEGLGCAAIVLTFSIYLNGSFAVPDNFATNSTWWAIGMIVGHSIRALVIVRRFW